MEKRRYTLKDRAAQQDRTRARILAATVALHQELGPRNTTIKAIAERAGVQRLTVYRHFHDDAELFAACTKEWLAHNPPPDPAIWRDVGAWPARLRAALLALYGYYRRTAAMWAVSYRDVADVPALQLPMASFEAYLDHLRDELLAAAPEHAARVPVRATISHCLRFSTWQSLAMDSAFDEAQIADLAVAWVRAAAAGPARTRG